MCTISTSHTMETERASLSSEQHSEQRSVDTSTPPAVFEHQPLHHDQPSIRLLVVSPDLSPEGLIQCAIIHTTIDCAQYSCLSYTWGAPEPKQPVLINGLPFCVQPNLHDFLSVVRTKAEILPHQLWIDAVCIDQSNNTERNHQVTQMSDIYSKAQQVFVWLGFISPDELMMKELLAGQCSRNCVYYQATKRDYWRRGWIAQELVFARRIILVINNDAIEFQAFIKAIDPLFFRARKRHEQGFEQYKKLAVGNESFLGHRLIDLLTALGGNQCSVVRDRLYCLVSLCKEQSQVQIDYSSPIKDVICNVVSSCTETCSACLTYALVRRLEVEVLPGLSDIFVDYSPVGLFLEFDIAIDKSGDGYFDKFREWPQCLLLRTFLERHEAIFRRTNTMTAAYSRYGQGPGGNGWSSRFNDSNNITVRLSLQTILYRPWLTESRITCAPLSQTNSSTNTPGSRVRLGYGDFDINALPALGPSKWPARRLLEGSGPSPEWSGLRISERPVPSPPERVKSQPSFLRRIKLIK